MLIKSSFYPDFRVQINSSPVFFEQMSPVVTALPSLEKKERLIRYDGTSFLSVEHQKAATMDGVKMLRIGLLQPTVARPLVQLLRD